MGKKDVGDSKGIDGWKDGRKDERERRRVGIMVMMID